MKYWRDYNGTGDEYRKSHDLDCILTGGNLNADTIVSLWLPLRFTLNRFETEKWQQWKIFEQEQLKPKRMGLKSSQEFLNDMILHIEEFLDLESELTKQLSRLFEIGCEHCNVMILPEGCRSWNTKRGRAPYWDYLPAFLYHLFENRRKGFFSRVVGERTVAAIF